MNLSNVNAILQNPFCIIGETPASAKEAAKESWENFSDFMTRMPVTAKDLQDKGVPQDLAKMLLNPAEHIKELENFVGVYNIAWSRLKYYCDAVLEEDPWHEQRKKAGNEMNSPTLDSFLPQLIQRSGYSAEGIGYSESIRLVRKIFEGKELSDKIEYTKEDFSSVERQYTSLALITNQYKNSILISTENNDDELVDGSNKFDKSFITSQEIAWHLINSKVYDCFASPVSAPDNLMNFEFYFASHMAKSYKAILIYICGDTEGLDLSEEVKERFRNLKEVGFFRDYKNFEACYRETAGLALSRGYKGRYENEVNAEFDKLELEFSKMSKYFFPEGDSKEYYRKYLEFSHEDNTHFANTARAITGAINLAINPVISKNTTSEHKGFIFISYLKNLAEEALSREQRYREINDIFGGNLNPMLSMAAGAAGELGSSGVHFMRMVLGLVLPVTHDIEKAIKDPLKALKLRTTVIAGLQTSFLTYAAVGTHNAAQIVAGAIGTFMSACNLTSVFVHQKNLNKGYDKEVNAVNELSDKPSSSIMEDTKSVAFKALSWLVRKETGLVAALGIGTSMFTEAMEKIQHNPVEAGFLALNAVGYGVFSSVLYKRLDNKEATIRKFLKGMDKPQQNIAVNER